MFTREVILDLTVYAKSSRHIQLANTYIYKYSNNKFQKGSDICFRHRDRWIFTVIWWARVQQASRFPNQIRSTYYMLSTLDTLATPGLGDMMKLGLGWRSIKLAGKHIM